MRGQDAWRIRLVAYGARLESVLGASPQGFESPILRQIVFGKCYCASIAAAAARPVRTAPSM